MTDMTDAWDLREGDTVFVLASTGTGYRILFEVSIDMSILVDGTKMVITSDGMRFHQNGDDRWYFYDGNRMLYLAPKSDDTIELVREAGREQRAYKHEVREARKTLQRKIDILASERNKLINTLSNLRYNVRNAEEKLLRDERALRYAENRVHVSQSILAQATATADNRAHLEDRRSKLNDSIESLTRHIGQDSIDLVRKYDDRKGTL